MPNKKKIKAFTLVEIMIVVSLIAILAVSMFPLLIRAKISANHSSTKASLKAIGTALESYLADHQVYPANIAILQTEKPEYIVRDYFDGEAHAGYNYTVVGLDDYSYKITASPLTPRHGEKTFTLTEGLIIND